MSQSQIASCLDTGDTPSDAEICEARAAEFRRKAEMATEPFIKEKFLALAQEWQELSAQFTRAGQ